MKTILTLIAALVGAVSAQAVYFTSAPGTVASGQSYTVSAEENYSQVNETYLYKNGAFFAYGSNYSWGSAIASGTTTDWNAQTVVYDAYSYSSNDWDYEYFSDYAQHSVTISQPNSPPSIEWSIAPSTVPVNSWYSVQAHGSDSDGNLSNVWVDRDWVPFAYGLGGDGYNAWSGNSAIESSPCTITYQARSWDLTDAMSNIIQHPVVIVNNAPTITWTINPTSSWVNETFNIQARGNDSDGNLAWVRVWKNGEVFAWHGGGNGFESYTNVNGATNDRPGVVQFTALAGDAQGAQSALLVHNVTIANHAPRNPQLTGSVLEVWTDDGTRNWIDLAAHVEDQDRNLETHTIWLVQGGWGVGPLVPLTTSNTQNLTPPNSQVSDAGVSNKTGRIYPNTPGRVDFHTNGQDNGGEWSTGASITVYVYSPRKDAAFVSQTFNNIAVTNPAQTTFQVNNRQVIPIKVKMRNTGDYPWTAGFYPFKLKSVGANWGTDASLIPAGVSVSPFIAGQNEYEFVFNITAPDTVGQTLLQWRMQQDLPQPLLFGASSVPITIDVKDVLPPSVFSVTGLTLRKATSVTINWSPATDNGQLLGYNVRLNGNLQNTSGPLSATSFNLTGLVLDNTYTVQIQAIDAAGNVRNVDYSLSFTFDPNADYDGDGMPNGWEQTYGLDPYTANRDADSDGDGITDFDEYTAGSNPAVDDRVGAAALPTGWPNQPTSNTNLVGFTKGSFVVDPTGSATYTIPIWVSPGTNGMQPSLALSYSSSGSNGYVGVGWSLSGVSAITRRNATLGTDGRINAINLDANDSFALDGQRLHCVAGTSGANGAEYRTERESFSRIFSYGATTYGPDRFVVKTKSGLTMEFGSSAAEDGGRITASAPASSSAVVVWALDKITDVAGNFCEFHYVRDSNGEFYVDRAVYGAAGATSTPFGEVKFDYENRTDVLSGFVGGAPWARTKRLKTVSCKANGTTIRRYDLTYEDSPNTSRSRLKKVQEFDGESASAGALPAITFDYKAESNGWSDDVPSYHPSQPLARIRSSASLTGTTGAGFLDVTGDGLPEFLYKHLAGTTATTDGGLNSGTGFVTLSTALQSPRLLGQESNYPDLGLRFVDLDGDGLLDIIVRRDYTLGGESLNEVWLNRPDGWQPTSNWLSPYVIGATSDPDRGARFVDLDGDGLTDVFWSRSATGERGARRNSGSGWVSFGAPADFTPPSGIWMNSGDEPDNQVRLVDLNGDGLVDIAEYEVNSFNGRLAYLNTGTGWQANTDYAPREYTAAYRRVTAGSDFVDLNGDGLVDQVIHYRQPSGSPYSKAWLNTGKGWQESVNYRLPYPLGFLNSLEYNTGVRYGAAFVDVNGDGLVDFIYSNQDLHDPTLTVTKTFLNTGWGWQESGNWSLPLTLAKIDKVSGSIYGWAPTKKSDRGVQVVDLNGDGAPDLVQHLHDVDASGSPHTTAAYLNKLSRPDLLEKITSSAGLETSLTYKPLTDKTGVYNRGARSAASTFPLNDVQAPVYVVRTVTQADGIGGTYTETYSYGELRHSFEVGNVGFAWIKVTDSRANTPATETRFRQDVPFVGLVAGVTTTFGSKLLREVTNSWDKIANSGNARVSFPYCAQTITKAYEPNAEPTPPATTVPPFLTTTVSTAVSLWGDPTDVITQLSDGWETHESREPSYVPSATATYPGQMSEMTVSITASAVAPNAVESKTRSSKIVYDSSGRVENETVEPSDLAGDRPYYKKTSYARDTYGNISGITITAPGVEDRATSFEYSAAYKGRFLTKKTVGSQITEFADYDTGVGVPKTKTEKAFNTNTADIETVYTIDTLGRAMSEYRKIGSATKVDGTTTVSRFWSAQGPASTLYAVQTLKEGAAPVIEFFDAMGRVRRTATVSGDRRVVKTDTAYNSRGFVESVTRPYYENTAYYTTTTYDVLARATSVSTPVGTYTRGHDGFIETISAPAVSYSSADGISVERSLSTATTRNSQGWTMKVVQSGATKIGVAPQESAESQITYTYDPFGALKSTTDSAPVPNTITYTPDLYGRRIGFDDPDRGVWSYKYWGTGELRQQVDALQNKTEFAYDNLGRVTMRTVTPGAGAAQSAVQATEYSYDGAPGFGRGSVHTIVMKEGTTTKYSETHAYDSLARETSLGRTFDNSTYTFGYNYDAYGRLNNTTYPGAGLSVRRFYTGFGHLVEIRKSSDLSLYFRASEFAADGQIEYALYGNGVGTDRSYRGEDGLVQAIQTGPSGAPTQLQDLAYLYEPGTTGNLYKRMDARQAVVERFTYDSLVRLKAAYRATSIAEPGTATLSMVYNVIGNLTSRNGQSYAYSYTQPNHQNPMPHAVSAAMGNNYAYDAAGNLTSVSGSKSASATWTAFNQPLTLSVGGASSTFSYGPGYERVLQQKSIGSKIVYVGREFERETASGGATTDSSYIFTPLGRTVEIVHQNGVQTAVKYYFTDHLGSVDTVVTNSATGSPDRLSYDAWGTRRLANWQIGTPSMTQRRGFTDHEMLDALGLIHMNGRVYDPALGRFLSPDPVNQDIYQTQTYNAYSYVLNNPLSYTDPTGMVVVDFSAQNSFGSPTSTIFSSFGFSGASWAWSSGIGGYRNSSGQPFYSSFSNNELLNQAFRTNTTIPGEFRAVSGWRSWAPVALIGAVDEWNSMIAPIANNMSYNLITGRRLPTVGSDPGYRRDYRYLSNYEKGGRLFNTVVTVGGFLAPESWFARAPELGRAGSGMGYAAKVLEGGTGRALAGHGELRASAGNFMTTVPEGSAVSLWTRPGVKLPDSLGRAIEAGQYETILANPQWAAVVEGGATHLPGSSIPNYFLKAPDNLTIFSSSITVQDATRLSTLMRQNPGVLDWAACTVIR